ncbi:MAG: hypothetical protein FWE57_10215 [Chitinispirillia bacterium]|nr:hypothetical protein [Chitinispirillia bacterium]
MTVNPIEVILRKYFNIAGMYAYDGKINLDFCYTFSAEEIAEESGIKLDKDEEIICSDGTYAICFTTKAIYWRPSVLNDDDGLNYAASVDYDKIKTCEIIDAYELIAKGCRPLLINDDMLIDTEHTALSEQIKQALTEICALKGIDLEENTRQVIANGSANRKSRPPTSREDSALILSFASAVSKGKDTAEVIEARKAYDELIHKFNELRIKVE